MRTKKPRIVDGVEQWRCPTCSRWLTAGMFYRRATPSGLSSQCRECHNAASIRTRDPERARASNAAHMRRARCRDPERFRRRERERARPSDEKVRARRLLNAAVRVGALARPDTCERCGIAGKVHGHHHDYSQPLSVTWLCHGCHGRVHRRAA